ncbi:death-inducer obliterator 1 isoform 1-T1 [Vipera latastei]
MLNDSDLLLPSCDSSLGLSGQEGLIPATSNAVSEVTFWNRNISTMEEDNLESVTLESQSNMESSSLAADEKDEQSNEDEQKTVKPTSKEFKKTWGFRRTTIAKREGLGDADMDIAEQASPQQQNLAPRRSGRQPKRTERVEEFLTTVRRRGRKNLPAALEDLSEPASCHVTDVETASEGSVDSMPDIKNVPQKNRSNDSKGQPARKGRGAKEHDEEEDEEDTSDSDSDGLTLKELQNRLRKKQVEEKPSELTLKELQNQLRKKHQEQIPAEAADVQTSGQIKHEITVKQEPGTTDNAEAGEQGSVSKETSEAGQIKKEIKCASQITDELEECTKGKSEAEVYDPSTLYCICQQPHNNRFMICCDRCEEWFHGDCVGISEARGRLLERNGEDYICPNCTILQVQDEIVTETDRQETVLGQVTGDGTEFTSIGTIEQKSIEDQGIKGRIEKAANPSGKKKLKIFQPVVEDPEAANCIGPGCCKVAQPGSVYCGNECILKHAAATMKFLSEGKEQKPKEKTRPKPALIKPQTMAGTKPLSMQKRPVAEKREMIMKKTPVAIIKTEANAQTVAKEPTPESATPSWASDHNYNAVKPEQTPAISPALLFKSHKEERKVEDKPAEPPVVLKKTVGPTPVVEKHVSSQTRSVSLKKPSPFASTSLVKSPVKHSAASFKGVIPRKSSLATGPPASGGLSSLKPPLSSYGASSMTKKPVPPSSTMAGLRKPTVSSTAAAAAAASSSAASFPPQAKLAAAGANQSQPNSQIRQNIRRSLKEILWKRVNDSDDLIMTENEVGKIALNIEKELFNLFQATDNRYKSKYRSIMFNLKDPKNQGLFHRVLREDIPLSRLVRMKPEELVSKELSSWKEKPAKSIMASRRKTFENKKMTVKQEPIPDINMEDSPPVSDSDEQQESERTAPEKSSAPILDVFSSMLQDTTSQHRAHLFDLNCKICTGQISASDEESSSKKPKSSAAKKTEPKSETKSKLESSTPADDREVVKEEDLENVPEAIAEPVTETMAQPSLERTYIPLSQVQNNSESSLSTENSAYPTFYTAGVMTTVTVSGKDPRTAVSTSAASSSAGISPLHPTSTPDKGSVAESKPEILRPVLSAPKSILTKPSSSDPRYLAGPSSLNVSMSEVWSPPEGDTSLFLSRVNTIWKGFINMQSVAKFVTKAYPVSGCFDYLSEDLPDTIHIGGRISPKTVWDYIGKLKSSVSKELCLIRFHPATEEEEAAYISLYSYFSSRCRFGVVANNNRHVKDLYLIPLRAKDPIPSKLLPFEGPGLESNRPNLILGLVICQKTKRPAAVLESEKPDEKRSRVQMQEETEVLGYSKGSTLPPQEKKSAKFSLYSGEATISATPPGSPPPPPPNPPSEPPSTVAPSVLKILSSVKAGSSTTVAPSNVSASGAATTPVSSTGAPTSKSSTPLDHILETLFGKKKSFDPVAKESEATLHTTKPEAQAGMEEGPLAAPLIDPIVQQFGQMSKDKAIEEEEDDRPYDPEEEYAPERAFEMQAGESRLEKGCETSEQEDEAYDPEDETILEEAKVAVEDLPNKMYLDSQNNSIATSAPFVPDAAAAPSLVEQQKMLEELNKQIEEQKRQLEEQEEALRQQRAAVGVSMAHFSVSDALMSPPPKSSVAKTELFQHEKPISEKSEMPPPSVQPQLFGQGSDPRQSRDPRQARRILTECSESADFNTKQPVIQGEPSAGQVPPSGYSGPLQAAFDKEEKCPNEMWIASETVSAASEQNVPVGYENVPPIHPEIINKPAPVEPPTSAPVRKVLLPTPPAPCFVPIFSGSNNAPPTITWSNASQDNSVPGVVRDSFPSSTFASQEKVPGQLNYEGEVNPQPGHFYEQMETPALQSEEVRGGPPFSSAGPKGGPPVLCGASDFHGQRGPPQQFNEGHNVPPNNDGQRGPPPNRFPPPRAPIPSLFSAPHGPPVFVENRGPSPSFPGGPREKAPSQFEDHRDSQGEQREFSDSQYREMSGPPGQFEGSEPPQFVGNRGPPPFPFGGQRRPPPSQFKNQRGGPSAQFGGPRGPSPNHFGGTRGPPPNQFEGQRGPAPGHMPGPRGLLPSPFEERRGSPPPRFPNQRGSAPHQFGGPRGQAPASFSEQNDSAPNRHNFPGQSQQGMKPSPRPLLDLPSHPPQHRKEMWDESGPSSSHPNSSGQGSSSEAQWPASDFREGRSNDYRGQAAFEGRQRERFEGGNKEKALDQLEKPDNRANRGNEDRRRDREHNWAWERDRGRNWNRGRERDWERQKEKDWDKNRDRNYNKDRERDLDRVKDWERNRERTRAREGDSYRRRNRSRSRDRDYDRFRDRARSREREKERDRERDRDKDRGRDRKERSKSTECDRDSKPEAQTGSQKPSHLEAAPAK